jgi:hypothetical protein
MATRIPESMHGLMVWLGLADDNSAPATPPSLSLVPPPVACTRPLQRSGELTTPAPPRPSGPPWAA